MMVCVCVCFSAVRLHEKRDGGDLTRARMTIDRALEKISGVRLSHVLPMLIMPSGDRVEDVFRSRVSRGALR